MGILICGWRICRAQSPLGYCERVPCLRSLSSVRLLKRQRLHECKPPRHVVFAPSCSSTNHTAFLENTPSSGNLSLLFVKRFLCRMLGGIEIEYAVWICSSDHQSICAVRGHCASSFLANQANAAVLRLRVGNLAEWILSGILQDVSRQGPAQADLCNHEQQVGLDGVSLYCKQFSFETPKAWSKTGKTSH